jgi:dipeptidyl aminopeptidase/acylaminoacyl peptidase
MTDPSTTPPLVEVAVRPYGTWPSPIGPDDLVVDTVRLAEPWVDGEDRYWVEGRATEGGRRVLVQATGDGATVDLTPAPFDVRTTFHEYGGGSFVVAGGTIVFSHRLDGRLYRLDQGDTTPVAITPEGPVRYGDLRPDLARGRILAVREDHRPPARAVAAIVAVPLDGGHEPRVLVQGPDFLAAPRLSPDGARLAWLEWDHPDMPWEATRLRVAPVEADGTLGQSDLAAGGLDESIVQPEWGPDGTLHFVSDRSGWWNLYRLEEGPRLVPLAPAEAEFADPTWTLDQSTYAFLADGSIVAVARSAGRDRLYHLEPGDQLGEVQTEFTEFSGLRAGPSSVLVLAASPTEATVVLALDPETLAPTGVLRRSSPIVLDPDYLSRPEPIAFQSTDGREAYALYYAPRNPVAVPEPGELPPLVVHVHGGPTSNASTGLNLDHQLLASRGIAVVDVDYGGSSGYGRAYRRSLGGGWGIVDVDDCVAAASFLVDRGDVDPERLAIEGSSAGGFTALSAITFRDRFSAGISEFGIGDLEALARDTHKFESRYMDGLVGPYPAMAAVYRQRSPLHFLDEITCPVLVLQGLDDHVVPPSQADAIVAALAANDIPYAYIPFEGEGHGFRGADAIRRTAEAKIGFLGAVFGFAPVGIAPLELPGLPAWRARRRVPV